MAERELRYRILTVKPGEEHRVEGYTSQNGECNVPEISSYAALDMLLWDEGDAVTVRLDNPVRGLACACYDERDEVLIPGESTTIQSDLILITLQRGNAQGNICFQLILLDRQNQKDTPLVEENELPENVTPMRRPDNISLFQKISR